MTTLQPTPEFENHPKALELDQLVRQTRTRLRLRALLTGLGWCLCFPLALLLAAACVDMFWPFPIPLRVIMFYSLLFLPLILAVFTIIRPAFERMPLQKVALRIEAFIPGMHNRLVTVLDLIHGTANPNVVQAVAGDGFAERLLEQTRARLANFNPNVVANLKPVYRAATALAIVAAAFILVTAVFHDRMPTALARLLQPTADIAPVALVKLDADPGDVAILQGDPVTITAKVLRGTPDDLALQLQTKLPTGGYSWVSYPLTKDAAGNFAFTLTAIDADASYKIQGGGTWSPRHTITMIRRPAIQHIDMQVTLPSYTRLYEPRPVPDDAAQVSALAGSSLQITAKVDGSPKRGEVQFLKAIHATTSESREQELLWFDNDFPADAKILGKPRWTSDQAPTPGTRTHTFDYARETYGFTSRVTRLEVRPSTPTAQTGFFLATYLDPSDPPSRITLGLTDSANAFHVLTWGVDADKPVPGMVGKPTNMGPLPKPGEWTRLEIPFAKLTANAGQPIVFTGIMFNTDHGRMWFSRAGALERRTETATHTTYEKAGVVKMVQAPSAATQPASLDRVDSWTATIPVETDGLFSLNFFTENDHPSLPMKPIELVATVDQPPTLVVERPGGNISVNDWAAVPVLARAFDDYGVQTLAIQVGTDPAKLGDPIELASYKKMGLNQVVLGSIDVNSVLAGKTGVVMYKVSATDSKGQTVYSDLFRINVAAPNVSAAAPTKALIVNAPILDGLNKLMAVQVKVSDATAKLLSNLPPPPAPSTQPDTEAKQEKTYIASLTPEQQANFAEVVRLLAERQAMAEVLQKQYEEAAKTAQNSPTALPVEAAALNAMADNLRQMAMDKNDQLKANADTLAKLQAMQGRTPEQEQQMKDLQRQMGELQTAHDQLAKNPQEAQQTLSALNTELTADRVGDQLEKVKTDAEQQAEALDALRKQVDAMKDQIANATPEKLNELARQQQQLDAVANALVERQNAALADPANQPKDPKDPNAPPAPEAAVVPASPWVPPARNADADKKPEIDGAAKPLPPAANADPAAAAQAKAPEDNPWDKPTGIPALPGDPNKDPNSAEDPAKPKAAGNGQPETPRQQFAEHAAAVDKSLQQAQSNLASAQAKANDASAQLNNALDAVRLKGLNANDPASDASAATAALQKAISSSSMRWAMNTANREQQLPSVAAVVSNAQAQADGKSSPQDIKPNMGVSGMSNGAMPRKIDDRFSNIILTGDGPGGPSAAGVYRLPPGFRQPILQGMQEKGPDGYQPIIDAYYRLISKDQPQ